MLSPQETDFLRSLTDSELELILATQTPEIQRSILIELASATGKDRPAERDRDANRKRKKRSEAARIEIPWHTINWDRRNKALEDPELFLRTYFSDRYKRAFDPDRQDIIHAMWEQSAMGGRYAMATSRGRGKTEIVKGMLCCTVCANRTRFPFVGGQTKAHGLGIYTDIRKKFAENEILYEDFPEICHPVRELDGAPSRAGKQHIDGIPTRIAWTATNYLCFPTVAYPPDLPEAADLPGFGGVKLAFFGLDAAFRGKNIDGDRPDFIVVDDPETEESARSLEQIAKREKIINQDIAGLVAEGEEIAIAVFSTVQNRYCLSFKLTDPEQYPQFGGKRYGLIKTWPKNMDMWEDYISMRKAGQLGGDRHGLEAVRYYVKNREAMDDGAEVLSEEFTARQYGKVELVHSSLQVCFDKIADTNMEAFRTEYQNDPVPEEAIESIQLTAARVQSRMSNLPQREIPSDTKWRTIGLDLGKYSSNWTDVAWAETGCVPSIPDYGVMETTGLVMESEDRAIEHALLEAMETWADIVAMPLNPDIVLIDSGRWPQAVYEFCRRRGRPFYPAKGWDDQRFKTPKRTDEKVPFLETYAHWLSEDRVWLYNVNTEYWKKWLQLRFLTEPYTDESRSDRTDGSCVLYHHGGDLKRHLSFSHHIVAEEEQLIPVDGKEMKRIWFVKNRNNHWLDSTALAMAGGGTLGIRLVKPTSRHEAPRKKPEPTRNSSTHPSAFSRNGRPFLTR